jgi:hypothetical protein
MWTLFFWFLTQHNFLGPFVSSAKEHLLNVHWKCKWLGWKGNETFTKFINVRTHIDLVSLLHLNLHNLPPPNCKEVKQFENLSKSTSNISSIQPTYSREAIICAFKFVGFGLVLGFIQTLCTYLHRVWVSMLLGGY